ncbi:MAG TPA: stage III sporulation protein AD [Bacillota bacterium]|nr:stage III sporulation protein AD [Bacillota bacterium]
MSTVIPFVGIALVAVVLLAVLRVEKPEMAVLLSVAVGVLLFFMLLEKLGVVIQEFHGLTTKAGVDPSYLRTVFKVVGIAYLTGFGAQICRDSGEGALALKVEMAGKVAILILTIPVMTAILQMLLRII